jgi:hypothetical protein
LGHSRPSQSLLEPTNVRCYSNSDHSRHECKLTLRATSGHSALQQRLALFDHLVGGGDQRLRECQAQRLSRLEVENKIELCGLFDGQIRWLRALQYLVHICCAASKEIGLACTIRHQTACEYVFAN